MIGANIYHPVVFFLITILMAVGVGIAAAYLSHQENMGKFQLPLLLFGLSVPCITSVMMILTSKNGVLIEDFLRRLMLVDISPIYLLVILFLVPVALFLATSVSLFFGYSSDQFSLTNDFSVMKGWAILGIAIPLVLAPVIEEIGWRGYGVDSLRAFFNLFTTSLLFGLLWSVWHIPVFFIKGYYHHQLWNLGILYVINFFASVFVVAILMNWVYYKTGRSIPAVILFHAVLNLFSMLFKTEPFTKCILTLVLGVVSVVLIFLDKDFFFANTPLPIVQG